MTQTADGIVKTALVTGAARRIGRAIVEDLAANGWAVAIHCARSRAEADALAGDIVARGGRAAAIVGDLGDLDGLGQLVEDARAALGPIGVLVNNAAMFVDDEPQTLEPAAFELQLRINLVAPCLLAQAFAAQVGEGERGLVVNIIDQRVWKPTPRFFSYSLSKSGLWSATRTLAQAFAPKVRVVGLGPGPTLQGPRQEEADFLRQWSAVPLGHGAELAEFGRAVRFLADMPSVTGQMIALDGGQHLAWKTPDVDGIPE